MKLALLGTGKIVEDALVALEPLNGIEKVAIFARPHSKNKGEALQKKHNITEVYTDVYKLLAESTADTIYIGLINSVHFEYAKKSLLAGKNVILEKPFTATYAEALELKEIAEKNKLFIFEAVTILHNEVYSRLSSDLNKIGTIRAVLCNYSQYSSRYDDYLKGEVAHSFDPNYCGGALYDINVYNVHYCVSLFGMPKNVQYYPNIGFNGIDISGSLVLQYDGFTAVCTGAKDSDSPCFVSIQGEDGYIRIPDKPNVARAYEINYVDKANQTLTKDAAGAMVRNSIKDELVPAPVFHRMTQEFNDFAQIIDTKDYKSAKLLLEETCNVVKVLEDGLNSAK